jgi:ribonuclease HII
MAKACRILEPAPDHLLIDGAQTIPLEYFRRTHAPPLRPPRQTAIVRGDQVCLSIAAASIIAKVSRDQMMIELDASYPQYGFAAHKGYCSVGHLEALRRYGPSPVHRRSFAPVRDLCGLFGILWKE